MKQGACALCQREMDLTFHHLIPRAMHKRKFFRKHYSKAELAQGIDVCRPCHNAIHQFFDEMQLAKQCNSLDKLLAEPNIQKHITWIVKQRRASV